MKSFRAFLILSLLTGIGAVAASGSAPLPGRGDDGSYSVTTSKGDVSVTPVTNDIFRVTSFPKRVARKLFPSQSAVLAPDDKEITTAVTLDEFLIFSPTTTVRVDRKSGRVSFYDAGGNLMLSEQGGVDNSGDVKSVTLIPGGDGFLYGAGERGHSLSLNGDSLTMYNRQNYGYTGDDPRISQMGISVPYFASDRGYGVLFDDYNKASLLLGDTVEYLSETPGPLSYFFINGDNSLSGVTEGYTELTGRQPLPPFWSLGYITSKYGYRTQDETLGVIDTLRREGYPVDGVVLDLYWYGKETDMGRLEWNREQWPDHRKMLADLRDKGVNTVLISQPYINKKGAIDNYNLLSEQGMLVKDSLGNTHDVTTWVGDAGMFDVSNPKTREWLWNRLKSLTDEGVAGWWGDLGEPEVHPLSMVHDNGQTASQYHNVYGNEWSRLIYEGLRKDFPEMRPMLMMRGGTAGLQRYGVFPWTTDVSRSWGGLQPQVNLMLSSGLSGLAYMSSDLGGFAVDPEHPLDPELYVRWLQMGAFTPMMRTHAQLKPEPYHYPQYADISRKFIKIRYEWLPYNYTLAYENAAYGLPLARPLNFNGDNPDGRFAKVSDEYMWGDEVLVAPVMKAGAKSRKVLFPEGEWINWNNPRLRYAGGQEAVVPAPLSQLPMFVRAGSFIPQYMQPIENVTQYDPQILTIKYFPSAQQTEYTLFDDNRLSPTSIEDNQYQLTSFVGVAEGKSVIITMMADGTYENMPRSRKFTFEIIGVARPAKVTLDSVGELKEARQLADAAGDVWSYDAKSRVLSVRVTWDYTSDTLRVD